jgi:hypothetical protein
MDHDDFDINETVGKRMRRKSSERAISQALGVTGDMTPEEEWTYHRNMAQRLKELQRHKRRSHWKWRRKPPSA